MRREYQGKATPRPLKVSDADRRRRDLADEMRLRSERSHLRRLARRMLARRPRRWLTLMQGENGRIPAGKKTDLTTGL